MSPEVTPSWSLAVPVLPSQTLPPTPLGPLLVTHSATPSLLIAAAHAVIRPPHPAKVHTAGFAGCFGCDSLAGHCANPHSSPGR